jgi:hypothetical protein
MAFFHKFEVFFELIGKCKIEHWLNAQIFPRFLKGMIPLCGNFPPQYGFPFRNGSHGFGVKRRVFGANGAFPVNSYVNRARLWLCKVHTRFLCPKYTPLRGKEQGSCLRREILLVKIGVDEKSRPAVIEIAGIFRSRVVDVSPATITIEATGDREKLNGLLLLLRPYGVLELARTGLVALERGKRVLEVPAGAVNC